VQEIVVGEGLTIMLETVNPRDWDDVDITTVVDRVVSSVVDGAVIGLHDGHRLYRKTGVATIRIVERLASQGYCFGVLDDDGVIVNGLAAVGGGDRPIHLLAADAR
jgi:peptidoglycan/xylan/chitin deacetylase (PgdA/CDA1 family)